MSRPELENTTFHPAARLAGALAYRRYDDPRPIDLKLDANEAPPLSLAALAELNSGAIDNVQEYPDARAVEASLAALIGVSAEQLVVTAGGDDALSRLAQIALEPGREALVTTPTFEMIGRYIRLAGAAAVETPWLQGPFPVDAVIGLVSERTSAIFIVSPNNPTGGVASFDDLERVSAAAPGALLVLDHAYAEFADEDLTTQALTLPNTVVVRTLSKAWGLAGLRVGYAVGPETLIGMLRAVGQPYAVSRPSIAAALQRVRVGRGAMIASVAQVSRERGRLGTTLTALGAEPLASQGNFVAARVKDAGRSADLLAGLGIAVRAFRQPGPMKGFLRITCPGNEAAFDRLSRALRAVLKPEAIFFDLDGVLADVSNSYRRAIIETAATFGVTVTREQIAAAKALGDANNDWILTRRLLAANGVEVGLAEVTQRFESLYQGTMVTPGFRASERLMMDRVALAALAARLPLAIVTGRPRADAEVFLSQHGLMDLFKTLVCMEDAALKPDPAPVRLALDRLGINAAWMLGDTVDDVRAARGAGVVPIGVVAPGDDPATASATLLGAGAGVILNQVTSILEILP